jgi:MFS-type transporter involved in bile tolerance (Atg22 family)
MIGADLFRAGAIGLLVAVPNANRPITVAFIVFAVGAGEAFFRPAQTALLPQILPSERLQEANGLMSATYRTAAVVGPGVGGLLVVGLGDPRLAYSLISVAFLLSALCLVRVAEPARTNREPANSFLSELRDGFGEVGAQTWLLGSLVAAALMMMAVVGPLTVLLPIVSRREFDSDWVYAATLAAFSIGGLIGAVAAIRWKPRHPGQASWLLALSFGGIPVALLYPVTPWLILAAYLVAGICYEPWAVWWTSALQRRVPPDRLARVSSVDWFASFALMPLGMAATGPILRVLGETTTLVAIGLCQVVISVGVLCVPGVRDFSAVQPSSRLGKPDLGLSQDG